MSEPFIYGSVAFPLTAVTDNGLLRDADPAVFYALEFFTSVLNTHLGERLAAEASVVGALDIQAAVAESIPIDPEQFLTEEHVKFPLLTLHRESATYKYVTQKRISIHRLKCAYVLPPLRAAQAERLMPILHAAALLLDEKCSKGRDDAYTPSTPAGTAGEFIWSKTRAGVAKVEVKESTVGAFQASNELFFPAVVLSIEMWELSGSDSGNAAYDTFAGVDGTINLRAPDGTLISPIVEVETAIGPTLVSISPTSGSASGGTAVTITGSGFKTTARPLVLFDGAVADAVVVTSPTTITCLTPPHAAYPSFVADLTVIETDGQVSSLVQAFTFNNP
jgi:hypothetical protein